ncbi:DUF982 domain-containing protein [Rhizobium sp. A37_96]
MISRSSHAYSQPAMSEPTPYEQPWPDPVDVDLPGKGRMRVANTREAVDCLCEHWPREDISNEYDTALRICLDVYEGKEPASAAREAVWMAATNAGLLVTSDR